MKKLHTKEKKKTVTLMFLQQFFIEAGLRGQVLRKTSLCGEKCTGNKPKRHWEVQLSTMIYGTYASWMCLVPLPCWLPLLGADYRLLGLGWSSNLNLSLRGSTLTGRRRNPDCQEFGRIMLYTFWATAWLCSKWHADLSSEEELSSTTSFFWNIKGRDFMSKPGWMDGC